MFIEERHQEIADIISANGKITVSYITNKYGISDESARRDLRLLEQKGLCKRTHGGAILVTKVGLRALPNRDYSSMVVLDTYNEIARIATSKIKAEDVIYITSGSFGYIMLSFLPKDIHYTVVVNSVDLGKELRNFENIDVYVVGGKMRPSGSIVDSFAIDFVSKLHFDICFVTGSGLTADFGLSNGTDETATFQRTVLGNSRSKCLLMPSSKIGINAFVKVCDVDYFDIVFTDWDCIEEEINAIEDKGVEVIVVEEPQ